MFFSNDSAMEIETKRKVECPNPPSLEVREYRGETLTLFMSCCYMLVVCEEICASEVQFRLPDREVL